MPRLDGTGPMGLGKMTGRGQGNCGVDKKNLPNALTPGSGQVNISDGIGRGQGGTGRGLGGNQGKGRLA